MQCHTLPVLIILISPSSIATEVHCVAKRQRSEGRLRQRPSESLRRHAVESRKERSPLELMECLAIHAKTQQAPASVLHPVWIYPAVAASTRARALITHTHSCLFRDRNTQIASATLGVSFKKSRLIGSSDFVLLEGEFLASKHVPEH